MQVGIIHSYHVSISLMPSFCLFCGCYIFLVHSSWSRSRTAVPKTAGAHLFLSFQYVRAAASPHASLLLLSHHLNGSLHPVIQSWWQTQEMQTASPSFFAASLHRSRVMLWRPQRVNRGMQRGYIFGLVVWISNAATIWCLVDDDEPREPTDLETGRALSWQGSDLSQYLKARQQTPQCCFQTDSHVAVIEV